MKKKGESSKLKDVGKAERSAYFARREAAKVLRCVMQGHSQRRASASIKSLVYKPSVRNKKATFALVCQTLKYLPILKKILSATKFMSCKWKRQAELVYIITYDVLFGQEMVSIGDAEHFVHSQKNLLKSTLARICIKENVRCPEDLLPKDNQDSGLSRPRYVRVNTLKVGVESALQTLKDTTQVKQDDLISDLLVLPGGTDLHDHPLVMNGCLFLQGKASCMAAVALSPHPDWEVLDACAAPGNKTVQLAGLMKGRGKIFACELSDQRLKRLEETVKLSGASNVEILHTDFLKLNPNASKFSKIRAILLDPSCSGSGTTVQRLDHLLPSNAVGDGKDFVELERINNLAAFQKKALLHALSFPNVERVVYSTCSIHQIENEDVISSVLPHARALNFQLATPFTGWAYRGLPVFEGAQHLLRTEAAEGMEGFFIALFVRLCGQLDHLDNSESHTNIISTEDPTQTHRCHPKVMSPQKCNAIKRRERSVPAKFHVEDDSFVALPEFNALHLKPKLHSRKLFWEATTNMAKKSVTNTLIRKRFGSPKILHFLYIMNCKKRKLQKGKCKRRDHFMGTFRESNDVGKVIGSSHDFV